jgi:hypothetical protein
VLVVAVAIHVTELSDVACVGVKFQFVGEVAPDVPPAVVVNFVYVAPLFGTQTKVFAP